VVRSTGAGGGPRATRDACYAGRQSNGVFPKALHARLQHNSLNTVLQHRLIEVEQQSHFEPR